MTEAELTKFLEDNKDAVLAATRAAVIEKIKDSMKWSLPDTVHTTVADFLKTEIAPDVSKMLADQKGVILEAAKKSAVALSDKLAQEMMKVVTESLTGYRAKEVFEALLGIKSRY